MTRRTGKSYELQVMRHLVQQRSRVAFEWDAKVPAGPGRSKRQIDIWLPDTREIVECKHHAMPVDVGVVDRLVGTVKDVNASAASIFSSSGFTRSALSRAQKEPIECITLPFASRFDEQFPATGGGEYSGDYIEDCLCAVPFDMAYDYGRVNYIDREENLWPLCVSICMDWGDKRAHRFVAYILLAHVLGRPPSDAAISELVACYGDRFELGQEWSISEREVWGLAEAELASHLLRLGGAPGCAVRPRPNLPTSRFGCALGPSENRVALRRWWAWPGMRALAGRVAGRCAAKRGSPAPNEPVREAQPCRTQPHPPCDLKAALHLHLMKGELNRRPRGDLGDQLLVAERGEAVKSRIKPFADRLLLCPCYPGAVMLLTGALCSTALSRSAKRRGRGQRLPRNCLRYVT